MEKTDQQHNNNTWRTVEEAAYSVAMDLNEGTERIEQYIHYGLKAARNWHFDYAKEIRRGEFTINDYYAIDLPADFVDWTFIGLRHGDMLKIFTQDNNIPLLHDVGDNGEILKHKDLLDDELYGPDVDNYCGRFNDLFNETIYGLKHKYNGTGYFRIHRRANQIQIRANISKKTKIYMEWISDGWDPNRKTLLHPYCFDLICLFIHWQRLKFNPTVPRSHVQEAKQDYYEEMDDVSRRTFDLTIEDVQDSIYSNYNQTPNY